MSFLSKLLARLFKRDRVDGAEKVAPAVDGEPSARVDEGSSNTPSVTHFQGVSTDLFPYDENLLERARTQWQFGDWQSLAQLNRDTLQHHPDRTKLVLLAAAGRLQTGQDAEAKQYIRLAQDWGVSKKLISQILIAGVHNSIGRAATIGNQQHRALQHFENAITIGTPGADAKLLTQARVGEQLHQIGLPTPEGFLKVGAGETAVAAPKLPPLSKNLEALTESLQQLKAELDAQLKKQADELIRVRKFPDSSLKIEVANATKQIEAAIGLQSYFNTGELPNINTERHNWPVSPDFALYLIELIELNGYDLIIEFGSGISTVIIAKTLAKMVPRRQGKPPVDFVSFDHLDQYYQQTRSRLEHAGFADAVQLVLAPLQDWQAPDGATQPYYTCQPTLEALAKKHPAAGLRLLVIIDGPPGATCKHARYPAGPLILQYFTGAQIDFLLDDYMRDDEKEIAKRWESEIAAARLYYTTIKRQLEKDACFIAVRNTKENS